MGGEWLGCLTRKRHLSLRKSSSALETTSRSVFAGAQLTVAAADVLGKIEEFSSINKREDDLPCR